ncbi:MAG: hypothetical protein HWN69_04190 [Desulfobacterales bacterium]|nr:hypothetical protein [Desulfobacterales bacterium]
MASVKKEYVMAGISTVLIPLGIWILKKIASKVIDKGDSKSGADGNNNLASDLQPANEIILPERR